ncbi:MAG TPA: hypothetical protein PLG90_10345 [Ignavibacteria bacterium]|nr:hypothetical protein [Ignavibacteria bacterium]
MKKFIYLFFISVVFYSCSESPVTPVLDNVSPQSTSNLINTKDFISNPDIILKSNYIAQLKISELTNYFQGNENLIIKINYSPDESGEFTIKSDKNIFDVNIKNIIGEVLFSSTNDYTPKIILNQNEIYSFEIKKNNFSNFNSNDNIYISTKKTENTETAIIDFSLNSCEACYISNAKFDNNITTQSFNGSEFYQCKFENIRIENSTFTNTYFLNSDFNNVNIVNSNFDYANYFKIQFSSSTFGSACNLNNTKFISSIIFTLLFLPVQWKEEVFLIHI